MIAGLVVAAAAWTAPVAVPRGPTAWAAAPAPGWLEVVTGGDLGRVRLLDRAGNEIPYRLVDPAVQGRERWSVAEVRNLRVTSAGFACDVVGAGLVDALALELTGETGVLEVRVTDGTGGVLVPAVRVGRLRGVVVATVPLPLSDVPRLHLEAATLVPGLTLTGVRAHRAVTPRGPPAVGSATFVVRPIPGREGVWRLEPAGGPVRVSRLHLSVATPSVFRRRVRVLAGSAGGSWREVGSGTLERVPLADGRPGIESLGLDLAPGAYPRLRVEVGNGSEAPLVLTGARGDATPRWLVFPPSDGARPLHIEYGRERRSRSLESGALPVQLTAAVPATIGTRQVLAAPEPEPPVHTVPWADLLFVAAAGLLVLLGWRAFRTR